jgi:hypothetical protein
MATFKGLLLASIISIVAMSYEDTGLDSYSYRSTSSTGRSRSDYPVLKVNLIKNSSFEINGQPDLRSWIFNSNYAGAYHNAPPGGGQWSLWIAPGWFPQPGYARLLMPEQPGTGTYVFSAWMKSIKQRGVTIYYGKLAGNQFIKRWRYYANSESTWTPIAFTDTLSLAAKDILVVEIYAGSDIITLGNFVLFDLVNFKRIR